MNVHPRFRTLEDANLFMECVRTRKPFPKEKWVYPFIVVGSACVESEDYKQAPYEALYLDKDGTTLR